MRVDSDYGAGSRCGSSDTRWYIGPTFSAFSRLCTNEALFPKSGSGANSCTGQHLLCLSPRESQFIRIALSARCARLL
jgi:hypothetical protein